LESKIDESSEAFTLGLLICDMIFENIPVLAFDKLAGRISLCDIINVVQDNYRNFSILYDRYEDKLPFFNSSTGWKFFGFEKIPDAATRSLDEKRDLFNLIKKLLHPNPKRRIHGLRILAEPFFKRAVASAAAAYMLESSEEEGKAC